MVDALSRLSMGSVAHVEDGKKKLVQEVHQLARLGVHLVYSAKCNISIQSSSESSLVFEVKENQDRDPSHVKLKESVSDQKVEVFSQEGDSVLRCQGYLFLPGVDDLRQRILAEAYGAHYSIHPWATKIYYDLWEIYWWSGMKRDIVKFLAKCFTCQQVNIEQ